MILIISLILIYLTINNIYLYNKQKQKNLSIRNWVTYFRSLISVIFFIIFFIIFLRFLNIFRENSTIDLKSYYYNYNFIVIIVFLCFVFSLRKLIFLLVKTSFFRLHYFYLSPDNNDYCVYYYKFYINGVYFFCKKIINILVWFNFIMSLLLLVIFCYDLIFSDFILNYTLFYLKYYSLFKIIYLIIKFIALKQQLDLDYYIFNLYYIGGVSYEKGYFAETLSSKVYDINEYEDNVIKS